MENITFSLEEIGLPEYTDEFLVYKDFGPEEERGWYIKMSHWPSWNCGSYDPGDTEHCEAVYDAFPVTEEEAIIFKEKCLRKLRESGREGECCPWGNREADYKFSRQEKEERKYFLSLNRIKKELLTQRSLNLIPLVDDYYDFGVHFGQKQRRNLSINENQNNEGAIA